jgi:hypothetical protein
MNSTLDCAWQELGLAAPARRALISADITSLPDLTAWRVADLAQLHGIGTHAMIRLRQALADAQLAFAAEHVASE